MSSGTATERLAATARVHDLTVVPRNTPDIEGLGVPVLNPFDA